MMAEAATRPQKVVPPSELQVCTCAESPGHPWPSLLIAMFLVGVQVGELVYTPTDVWRCRSMGSHDRLMRP